MTEAVDTKLRVETGTCRFLFTNGGDLYEAAHGDTLINQLPGNPVDGSPNNLYLRLYLPSGIRAVPLLGVRSGSRLRYVERSAMTWEGDAHGVSFRVDFRLAADGIWFWDVKLNGQGVEADILYGQDIGLADKGAVRSNEAYMSQYIGHSVFEDPAWGYVICSRQNQPQQGGRFPYLQQGALTGAIGYATDGYQFFGLSYKETNEPASLTAASLANEIYQYEFAYAGLQSGRIRLDGEARIVFYGLFRPDHPAAVTALEYGGEVAEAWRRMESAGPVQGAEIPRATIRAEIGEPLTALPMTAEDLDRRFPVRYQEERDGDTLLSFFTPTHEHVVLKEKELRVERPHGHILMTGNNDRMNERVMTTTSFMYGLFNAQLVLGNTSFNKMLTNARNALNVMKTSGQRIYVEIDGIYRLLTLPSWFEMGFNYAKWHYRLPDDLLVVTNFSTVDSPEIVLTVRSESGRPYRYLVTNQVTMNGNEFEVPFRMEREEDAIVFRADGRSLSASVYPELRYRMRVEGAGLEVGDERLLADGAAPGDASLVVLRLGGSAAWQLTVQGSLDGEAWPSAPREAEAEAERYRRFYEKVMNGFRLGGDEAGGELDKVNALAWWYTHNMLVHYSVPHGLEQYGGAAWGTRDVCQGPVEYFLATHKHEAVREVLLTVYAHQYEDTGNWPQWFMFDRYFKIQQEESHGDIIVWPLKVLGDYLRATRDFGILEAAVPYTDRHTGVPTETRDTVLGHARKEIAYIRAHFLHGTHLSAYGDGDWDDTLQPANAQLKRFMVSSWTVALTYQTLKQLSAALAEYDGGMAEELGRLASGIEEDFRRYMLRTDVIPGFLYMEEPERAEPMLHPDDTKTGIHYRLLPMTRSMIAELLTAEQAQAHYKLIKERLYCPDGVRLMNRPARYAGGVSTHFKRAEQAANFGREIGLQYVHAHIRYVEAMAKLGRSDEAWQGLLAINPIGLRDVVPNAAPRQSNAYFSSSDGQFNDRYEAQERFEELRAGKVPVKGGWRIYSSGPGIYMNQLISNCLGIRLAGGDLVVDPVLPARLDGLRFAFRYMDRPVTFVYHLSAGGGQAGRVTVNGAEAPALPEPNRYREGGWRIGREWLARTLSDEGNVIDIYR
ncbi:GH36-type glycosyl hydrolase domain-containing protein [Cohnella nanjingensis]|uniref:Cellobiose phosphorylase n=1 Tax=Cohnella nanjingensis TaxID=1387779 RepID=A0A7X0RRA6_9BACL|nr:cellobiose phosphorylase [Cohnella nanjingensis]MBB6672110.1 cellobiose phosphorylase [Cohnella nanjingensis]